MIQNKYNKRFAYGFTLIELLVVISIIAILATLIVSNYNAARERARDAERKADLRNIQTALRLYYNDFRHYPTGSGAIEGCGTGTSVCVWDDHAPFSAGSQVYMSILPDDPSPDRDYEYTYVDPDNYTLVACLENLSDDKCDKDPNTGNILSCTSPWVGCKYTVKP